jgi:hypothetical protein
MENIDVIILTVVVVIAFVIFIITSFNEINKIKEEPYEFEKASGFTRAALFNVLSSLFEDEEIPAESREKFKSTLKRTISDMETDGMYFDKTKKSQMEESKGKKPGSNDDK